MRQVQITAVAITAASLLVAGCNRTTPAEQSDRAPAPPAAPAAPKPPAPGAVRLYVSDETGGNVIVVDPEEGTVVERIAVGKRPRGIRLSRDGKQLLIALSGSPIAGPGVDESKLPPPDRSADGIGVLDLATHKMVRTHDSGQDPESFDISPDGTKVYVSNEDAAEMSVLDLASGKVTTRVKVGEEPEAVTLRPDGSVAYVGCEGENEVVAVDTASAKVVGRIKTGPRPRGIAFTSDGATAFVGNENGASITVVDGAKHTVLTTINDPEGGVDADRAAPDGSRAVAGRPHALRLARPGQGDRGHRCPEARARFAPSRTWAAGPGGIGLSADGRKIYTANGGSADVSVVDAETGKVEKRITTGGSPWGVVVAVTPR